MKPQFSVLVYATQHMKIGGIESHIQQFCQRLAEKDVRIDLIILNADMFPETELFFKKICRCFYAGKQGKSYRRFLWLFWVKLKLINRRYDAVYTNGQGGSIRVVKQLFSRSSKWVHHYHQSGDTEDQLTWGESYRKALTTADVVIACSNSIGLELKKAIHRNIQIIPCFSREVVVNPHIISNGKLRFGYYGRLIAEKGIDLLCRLSEDAALEQVEFHIWGEGNAYPSDFFLSYPNIHYHGAFSGEQELASVIGSLDAYLLLSKNPEALPIVLLEVMSAGLPWLATDRGGIPDIFNDPVNTRIISAFSTYEETKTALLNMAADIRNGKINRASLQDIYKKRFSHEILVKKWVEILGPSM